MCETTLINEQSVFECQFWFFTGLEKPLKVNYSGFQEVSFPEPVGPLSIIIYGGYVETDQLENGAESTSLFCPKFNEDVFD